MKSRTFLIWLFIAAVLLVASCSDDDNSTPTEPIVTVDYMARLVSSMNDFSWELFADVNQYRDSGNIHLCGPANYRVLSWIWTATYDETYDEMKTALNLDLFTDTLYMQALATLVDSLERPAGATQAGFDIGVFSRVSAPMDTVLVRRTEQYFDGIVYSVNYADSLLDDTIRNWMETASHEEFSTADGAGSLIETFALYSMSYFHGEWSLGVDTTANTDEIFRHPYLGDTLVEMMHGQGQLAYYQNEELQFVDIPFGESGYSVALVIPLEATWPLPSSMTPTAARLETWLEQADTTAVTIHLPPFKLYDIYDHRDNLERLGVYRLFHSTQSQWLPLANGVDGHVSSFWESIRTRFTSDGITMASAKPTAVSAAEISVNQPFYYVLRDNTTGVILGMGRVMEPW